MTKIKSTVEHDHSLIAPHLIKDGEVPPILFFHFKKLNKDISKLMNQMKDGSLDVKNGFYISLNDPDLMESRTTLLKNLAAVFAAMKHLDVLSDVEAIVFTSEAFASEDASKRPSEDKNAKEVFMSYGQSSDGKSFSVFDKKLIKLAKKKGEMVTSIELAKDPDFESEFSSTASPVLDLFWETYKEMLVKVKEDGQHEVFIEHAKEDPVHVFIQGLQAALMASKL